MNKALPENLYGNLLKECCGMIGSIGVPEMIIILVIALIVFGPRKLPDLGRSLGKSLGEFKRASNDLRNTLDEEIRIEDTPPATTNPKEATGTPTESTKSVEKQVVSSTPTPAPAPASGIHPTEPDAGT